MDQLYNTVPRMNNTGCATRCFILRIKEMSLLHIKKKMRRMHSLDLSYKTEYSWSAAKARKALPPRKAFRRQGASLPNLERRVIGL